MAHSTLQKNVHKTTTPEQLKAERETKLKGEYWSVALACFD